MGVFNKTVIPLALVGYGIIMAISPQLMPFDLQLLELKFSSVLSTAVPVSGLILVLHRSVGSSPHLSLVSPVLSTLKHRLPVEPKIRFRVERASVTLNHMTHHCTKSFLNLKR